MPHITHNVRTFYGSCGLRGWISVEFVVAVFRQKSLLCYKVGFCVSFTLSVSCGGCHVAVRGFLQRIPSSLSRSVGPLFPICSSCRKLIKRNCSHISVFAPLFIVGRPRRVSPTTPPKKLAATTTIDINRTTTPQQQSISLDRPQL